MTPLPVAGLPAAAFHLALLFSLVQFLWRWCRKGEQWRRWLLGSATVAAVAMAAAATLQWNTLSTAVCPPSTVSPAPSGTDTLALLWRTAPSCYCMSTTDTGALHPAELIGLFSWGSIVAWGFHQARLRAAIAAVSPSARAGAAPAAVACGVAYYLLLPPPGSSALVG